MDLLMITNENRSHYVYIKDFNRFMCKNTINKNKKHFCKYCKQYNALVVKKSYKNIKKINGKLSVKLRIDKIKFKNHFK